MYFFVFVVVFFGFVFSRDAFSVDVAAAVIRIYCIFMCVYVVLCV